MFIGKSWHSRDEDVLARTGCRYRENQAILYGGSGSNHYFAVGEKLGKLSPSAKSSRNRNLEQFFLRRVAQP